MSDRTNDKGRTVRRMGGVPENWDGRCPKCRRGADSFGGSVWCDCEPWIEVGQLVRRMDGGPTFFSDPKGKNKGEPSLAADALGEVVELRPPESAHRCPNHDEFPDCVCAGDFGEDAMIPGKTASAVVAWVLSDGSKLRRLIWPKDEGKRWVRLCSICEQPKDDRPWTRNGGKPAHTECALGQSVKSLEDAGLRQRKRKTRKP